MQEMMVVSCAPASPLPSTMRLRGPLRSAAAMTATATCACRRALTSTDQHCLHNNTTSPNEEATSHENQGEVYHSHTVIVIEFRAPSCRHRVLDVAQLPLTRTAAWISTFSPLPPLYIIEVMQHSSRLWFHILLSTALHCSDSISSGETSNTSAVAAQPAWCSPSFTPTVRRLLAHGP